MSDSSCSLFEQPSCTVCDPRVPATPLSLANRPGLRSLRYRVGTFSTFRQAMLDALSAAPVVSVDPSNPIQTRMLTSRSSDDFAVAILELWAYVCDVLTFYQQAIANEAFLRPANLRESLARLAALLGYEPARGVAATALLAFFADAGASLTLPQGLQMQSVPPPGQTPETFETSQKLAILAAGNQPVLLGTPQDASFNSTGELAPGGEAHGPAVTPGTKLVFYDTSAAQIAEQVVVSATPTSLGGKIVQWRGTLNGIPVSSRHVARFGRKFRYFGANTPSPFPRQDPGAQTWSMVDVDFSTPLDPSGRTLAYLYLDGTYDGVANGARVLLSYAGTSPSVVVATVQSVAQGVGQVLSKESTPKVLVSGSCTVLGIDFGVWYDDRRALSIYELLGDDLQFRYRTNPDSIPVASDTIRVVDASSIHKGTEMVLVSDSNIDVVTATAEPTQEPIGSSGPPWAWRISITPKLAHSYIPSRTKLYANIASTTHGQTLIEQVLGDGDASQEWQEFAVQISPVTYVPDPAADRGARSTLRVFVNNIEWTEVKTFYGHGGDEPIFTTRVDDAGKMYVRFGNGKTGRRLPTGIQNVRAQLRKGLGTSGNADADTISVILQPLPGLKSVINPMPAVGGEDPETPDSIRGNAPTSVITLGRAVSLRDYEALALTYAGVAKAKANWADFGSRRGVALTAAAAGGKPLTQLAAPLRDFLDHHRDPNVPLSVSDAAKVHFVFRATLHIQAGFKQSMVKAAAEAALGPDNAGTGYLSFARLQFGQTIFQSALITVLQEVSGVHWVELREFSAPPSAVGRGFGLDPLRLDAVYVGPQEIAWPSLDDTDTTAVDLQYQGGVADL